MKRGMGIIIAGSNSNNRGIGRGGILNTSREKGARQYTGEKRA